MNKEIKIIQVCNCPITDPKLMDDLVICAKCGGLTNKNKLKTKRVKQ